MDFFVVIMVKALKNDVHILWSTDLNVNRSQLEIHEDLEADIIKCKQYSQNNVH